jgi:signal peptide peptidase SppA
MQYAARLLNRPLLLVPEHISTISSLDRAHSAYDDREDIGKPPPSETLGQIAVIPVQGILTNARDWWMCGTSYAEITNNLLDALADDAVKAIVLHVDSPGGECAGCAELGDLIYAARGEKPLVAILDAHGCSAAYWLASACDMVTVPAAGYSGSIGAIQLHFDITKMLDQAGIVVTTIQFGDEKADGYPTTKLTDPALARMQADIDMIGEDFVAAIARNRGLSPDKVRATQARAFLGANGVTAGLVDAVMSPTEAFAELMASLREVA